MPNREERIYHAGLAVIETFDADFWRKEWLGKYATPHVKDQEDSRKLNRLAFKLFINSQYATVADWPPFQSAYQTYRNRLFAPQGWDDQLTPPGLEELS